MTKCELCDKYFGPYSMEIHLREDHAIGASAKDRMAAYDAGYVDGQQDFNPREDFDPDKY